MNHLDCARRVAAALTAAILILPGGASAHQRARIPVPVPKPDIAAPAPSINLDDGVTSTAPVFSIIASDPDATPSIVKAARRIFCVEYARLRSGIEIFGDARTWWEKAGAQYAKDTAPQPGAVMVFASTGAMKKGHVAVVTALVSDREVRVDHANWGNDGRIYLNAPVLDVSAANDWSQVRVWDTKSGTLGSRVYPLKGFLSLRTASLQ
jgi:hypothetical protein